MKKNTIKKAKQRSKSFKINQNLSVFKVKN